MKLKIFLLGIGMLLLLVGCSGEPKEEFHLMQDGNYFSGAEVSIVKKPFTIGSTKEGYSIVIAKRPIRNLADHHEIVKLTGTSGAWYSHQLPFYQSSDLLSDKDACDVYYGHQGEECQAFIKEKTRLGFRKHYAYTFAEYVIDKKRMQIEKIGGEDLDKLERETYYLYFFRSEDKMGKVATSQRVTRMKLNLK